MGSGSAERARPGLSGPAGTRPGRPRTGYAGPLCASSRPLLAVGAGGPRGGGAAPSGARGAGRSEARTETAQVPGAAPEAGEQPRRPAETGPGAGLCAFVEGRGGLPSAPDRSAAGLSWMKDLSVPKPGST